MPIKIMMGYIGLYWDYIRIMDKKMEATIVSWGNMYNPNIMVLVSSLKTYSPISPL